MKFRSDGEAAKQNANVTRLTYDYVAVSIGERLIGESKLSQETLSLMRDVVPELSKPEIAELFYMITRQPEAQNETKARFDERVAEYSRQYGFYDIIMPIFARMDLHKSEALLVKITNISNAHLAYAKAAQSIENKCDNMSGILSVMINGLAASAMSIPADSQPELMAHLRSLEDLRTKLNELREPFRDADSEANMNKVNIAGIKLDKLLVLATTSLKKTNGFVTILEQRRILRKGELGSISSLQYSGQDDMIGMMDSVEKLLGSKGHLSKI